MPITTPPNIPDNIPAEMLLHAILARPDGDILNIVQAALELPGDMQERLSKAYHEITRAPLTEREDAELITLQPGILADDERPYPCPGGDACWCQEHR